MIRPCYQAGYESVGVMLLKDLASKLAGKVAVVGVGDTTRGDDGAGPLVIRLLADTFGEYVIDSGTSPELDTWLLRELMPDSVLFVDAVDIKGTPGDVALLRSTDLRSTGFDTHRAPLRFMMEYLEQELQCRCYLLAVQPKDVRQGIPMSDEVKHTVTNIADILRRDILAGM